MKDKELKSMRRKAIKEIIEKHSPIYSQDVIVDVLLKDYEIRTIQSTISRELKTLKIVKDKQSGAYTLSKAEEYTQNKTTLRKIMNEAETTFHFDSNYIPLLLECSPMYSDAVCVHLENTLNSDMNEDADVFAVDGPTGSICLYIPDDREKEIKQLLEGFVNA